MVGLLALNGEAMNNLKENSREDLWRKVGKKLKRGFWEVEGNYDSWFCDILWGLEMFIEVFEMEKLINSFLHHLEEIIESKDGKSDEIIFSSSL